MAYIKGQKVLFSPVVNIDIGSTDDKPDMLQQMVDARNSCYYLMAYFQGDNADFIKGLDISNVSTMECMYYQCVNLTSIPLLDTSKIVNMEGLVRNCNVLSTIPQLDTSNVTSMSYMFANCYGLENIPLLDTSQVRNMFNMFSGCNKLSSIPQLDTNQVTNMSYMFYNCKALTSVPQLNVGNVTRMDYMFKDCTSLTEVSFKYSSTNLTNANTMFSGCSALITINGELNLFNATTSSMFYKCSSLENLTLKNITKGFLNLGYSPLSLDSLINTIMELWDYSSETSSYLMTLGTANLDKIANTYVKLITPTAEQIVDDPHIESKMPCEVCESTDEGAMTLVAYANLKNWSIS